MNFVIIEPVHAQLPNGTMPYVPTMLLITTSFPSNFWISVIPSHIYRQMTSFKMDDAISRNLAALQDEKQRKCQCLYATKPPNTNAAMGIFYQQGWAKPALGLEHKWITSA